MSFTDFLAELPRSFSPGAIDRANKHALGCEVATETSSGDLRLRVLADAIGKGIGEATTDEERDANGLLSLDSFVCQLWLGDPDTAKRWNAALVPFIEMRDSGVFPPPVSAYPSSLVPYLERRAETSTRPDTRARYHDFLLLHPETSGGSRIKHARAARSAYLEAACDADLVEPVSANTAFEYLQRALELSTRYNIEPIVTSAAAITEMRRAITAGSCGFVWMIARHQPRAIVASRQDAVDFIAFIVETALETAKTDRHTERALFEVSISLAAETRDSAVVKGSRLAIAQSWEAEAAEHAGDGEAMNRLALLREAIKAYGHLGSGPEGGDAIERLKIPYAESVREAAKGLRTVPLATQTIDAGDLDEWVKINEEWLKATPHPWLLMPFRWDVWPDWGKVAADFAEIRAKAPLQWLVSRIRIDSNGQVIFPPDDEAEREEAYLLDFFCQQRSIHAMVSSLFFEKLHRAGLWTAETLIDAIREADEDLAIACASGLLAYEAGDYWTATHVLVPQLERAVRDIAMRVSGSVVRLAANQSIQMATLSPMLSDEKTIAALTPRVAKAFVEIFTDPSAMNIRNNAAHGLLPAGSDQGTAAYFTVMGILTAAWTLGVVKEQART